MEASILIVSKNRKEDLLKTLNVLHSLIDESKVEVLVFLDGCTDNSEDLQNKLTWVRWFVFPKSIGASAARQQIYPLATSEILIGLDDDAHPLNTDFVSKIQKIFDVNPNVGILAFEEIKGIFATDGEALQQSEDKKKEFLTSEFIGCGFAIKKSVYNLTNGFPVWIDIYGEESCLSIEVLDKGFDILYSNEIKVNHRVNKEQRKLNKQNYFRYSKQLKNETFFYLVYYSNPFKKIVKLYWHNLTKYGIKDLTYFKIYILTIFKVLFLVPKILKYRNPVKKSTILKRESL